jgi:hypothetical protein
MKLIILFDSHNEELMNRAVDKCLELINNDSTFLDVDTRVFKEE